MKIGRSIILLVICIVGFSQCEFDLCENRQKWMREHETPLSYNVVIAKKFLDDSHRGQPRFEVATGETFDFYNFDVYDAAAVGDSVIKKSGTLLHILKKRDTIIYFYPKCREEDITDL